MKALQNLGGVHGSRPPNRHGDLSRHSGLLQHHDPGQKVAGNVEKQMVSFSTNLLMYVFFDFFLIVLSLALYERMKASAPAIMQVTTVIGFIWAGSLIAGGMVANTGLATVVPLYAKEPAQMALSWQGIEAVANGLSNANGEILGGLWLLLVSLAALQAGGLPRGLNVLGLMVGAVGIISIIPGLTDLLIGVLGLSQIIWFGHDPGFECGRLALECFALPNQPCPALVVGLGSGWNCRGDRRKLLIHDPHN